MNREELAWAAGFFDGEGHISTQGQWGMNMAVYQVDRRPLERYQAALGGLGRIYLRSHSNPNHRPIHIHKARSFEQAQAIIALLWNWLSGPKREQAAAALQRYRNAGVRRRVIDGTRCPQGHAYTEENVYRRSNGGKGCRKCRRAMDRRRRIRRGLPVRPEKAIAIRDVSYRESA